MELWALLVQEAFLEGRISAEAFFSILDQLQQEGV